MERKIIFSEGEFYHIYNRGVDKRLIFNTNKDKKRFLKLLYLCNSFKKVDFKTVENIPISKLPKSEPIVAIGAYCLMDNHFHLLLKETKSSGISTFMSKLTTAYAVYFNKHNDRTGALFQGRFKARHCDNDEYLKYLYAYIHLNPLKIFDPLWKEMKIKNNLAKEFLSKFYFSSYLDYVGNDREEMLIINKKEFPEYFNYKSFEEFIDFWINFSESTKDLSD